MITQRLQVYVCGVFYFVEVKVRDMLTEKLEKVRAKLQIQFAYQSVV